MKLLKSLIVLFASLLAAQAFATNNLNSQIQSTIDNYLETHQKNEHVSAISLSVSLPNETSIRHFIAGTTEFNGSQAITQNNLFEIGSITKSYTAAILLQLEAEGKLGPAGINTPLRDWLPQYPKWGDITLKQLLNMSSGIPEYLTPAKQVIKTDEYAPKTAWTYDAIIQTVYNDKMDFKPGAKWEYSNTNYVLLSAVIEKITGHTLAYSMQHRLLGASNYNLINTHYYTSNFPNNIMARMVHGYNHMPKEAPFWLNKDMTNINMSMANGAGAIIANTDDIIRWVRALFQGRVLPKAQLAQMESMISVPAGKPIKTTSKVNPAGFGLGLGQTYDEANKQTVWFYEGETFGFRALYFYYPKENIVIAADLNSGSKHDDISSLLDEVYALSLSDLA